MVRCLTRNGPHPTQVTVLTLGETQSYSWRAGATRT